MRKVAVFLLGLGVMAIPTAASAETDANITASRAVIKQFFGELKGELVAAIKQGGPSYAIPVCKAKAPAIAEEISEKEGWEVGRTSLKLRNPDNAPDEWEKKVLESFDQRNAAGEDATKMEFSEVVEQDGKKLFRYMKAIPTAEKPCLACHGEKVSPEVEARLKDLYPEDKARGYKAGDIRGAFTIAFPVE